MFGRVDDGICRCSRSTKNLALNSAISAGDFGGVFWWRRGRLVTSRCCCRCCCCGDFGTFGVGARLPDLFHQLVQTGQADAAQLGGGGLAFEVVFILVQVREIFEQARAPAFGDRPASAWPNCSSRFGPFRLGGVGCGSGLGPGLVFLELADQGPAALRTL